VDKEGRPVDPVKRWKKVDADQRRKVEKVLGPFPIGTLADVPLNEAIYYSGRDTDAVIRLRPLSENALKSAGLLPLMRTKMAMFPADNLDIDSMLAELEQAGFIERYEVDNNKYIQIVNFLKHQNPHHKEQPSSIPKPGLGECKHQPRQVPAVLVTDSLNLVTDSLREKDAPPKGSAKATRIPENWELSAELQEWTFKENPRIDIKRVLDSFTDYWRSVPAAKGRKLDWDATWRNWVRRENGNSGTNRTRETAVQRSQRLEREYLAERGVSIP
jgi:hypothetical protein